MKQGPPTQFALEAHFFIFVCFYLLFLCRLAFFASSITFFTANRFLVFLELDFCFVIHPLVLFAMVYCVYLIMV